MTKSANAFDIEYRERSERSVFICAHLQKIIVFVRFLSQTARTRRYGDEIYGTHVFARREASDIERDFRRRDGELRFLGYRTHQKIIKLNISMPDNEAVLIENFQEAIK